MRIVLLALLMTVGFGLNMALAGEVKAPGPLFADAVKSYHAAQYEEAVKLNEALLQQGFFSPAVYYNLGNAQLKSGHLGKALVNYLRTQRLTPRDSDLRANLAFTRSLVENYKPWAGSSVFVPAQRYFSARELQWVGFAAFALTGAFLLGGLYAGLRHKRLVLGVVLMLAVTGYFVGAGVAQSLARSGMGVAIGKADARFEPSVQATTYFRVPEGTEVRVLREKDGWLKVERSDGKVGWVAAAHVERI